MCIDYRVLNKVSIKNHFSILKINKILNKLKNTKYFITLDLDNTYHQVQIVLEDRKKTLFTCKEEYFEFIAMTFSLINALVIFQKIINKYLSSYINRFI